MAADGVVLPRIALLGAGIFARTQYLPRLREIADCVLLKTIWSRTEDSARAAVEIARGFSPAVECKWGDVGLDEIQQDSTIHGVAVVLAGQVQVDVSLRMLKAGKHVIQEKPAAESLKEAETALTCYKSFCELVPCQPIWAVAENYRFEPAFVESRRLMSNIGDVMNIQVIVEGSMNSSNPYFSSSWRRKFTGGFILDMGVHFVAGLRMIVFLDGSASFNFAPTSQHFLLNFHESCDVCRKMKMAGCEIATVSAISNHVDATLPPPDNICSLFQLESGCAGVLVMTVSSKSPQVYWRAVGTKGTLQVERGNKDGKHGYSVLLYAADGSCQSTFYSFSGVNEELKAFVRDISPATIKGASYEPEPRSSFIESARDVAVLEAMLESSKKQGAQVHVKRF